MICNATPLIFLAKINQLELLKKIFNKITMPQAVKEEVIVEGKPGYAIINEALAKGWIIIFNPKNNIDLGLEKGENAAINLAKEKRDTIIIDDASAIKIAQSFNINFIRTTSVIFMAVEKNIINKKQALSLINKLVDAGYYISPQHYSSIVTKLNSS